jgi:drug/metabolite transporter (DMT)-like permease
VSRGGRKPLVDFGREEEVEAVLALRSCKVGAMRAQPGAGDGQRVEAVPYPFALWMVVPGIFGFYIIAGIPWAVSRVGAARVFVVIVAAQCAVSLLWDALVSGKPLTLARGGGALLALVGVALATWE